MTREDHQRLMATAPPAEGLARMAMAVAGRRARVASVRRLTGGVDAATHAVRLDPGGWVVLKRSWSTSGGALAGEFERLEFARRVAVPTPTPLAVDAGGEWFAHPALVMTRLPGRGGALDAAPGPWVTDLAEALVAIHDTTLPADLPPALREPHAGVTWRPPQPTDVRRNARVERLLEVALGLQADLAAAPPASVLLHHDFHHGNVTWQDGRLQGVVDWNEARRGPAASDVAYCSADLAMTHGVATADTFTRAYRAASCRPLDDLARWQALWIANAVRWVGDWVSGLHDAGATHLTVTLLRSRLRRFADQVLTRS